MWHNRSLDLSVYTRTELSNTTITYVNDLSYVLLWNVQRDTWTYLGRRENGELEVKLHIVFEERDRTDNHFQTYGYHDIMVENNTMCGDWKHKSCGILDTTFWIGLNIVPQIMLTSVLLIYHLGPNYCCFSFIIGPQLFFSPVFSNFVFTLKKSAMLEMSTVLTWVNIILHTVSHILSLVLVRDILKGFLAARWENKLLYVYPTLFLLISHILTVLLLKWPCISRKGDSKNSKILKMIRSVVISILTLFFLGNMYFMFTKSLKF